MSEVHYAFGIDIGGTNTKIGFFDQHGTLLGFHHIATDKNIPADKFIEKIAQESFALTAKVGIHKSDPRLIGVGAGAPKPRLEKCPPEGPLRKTLRRSVGH